jgi:hypothetical protein
MTPVAFLRTVVSLWGCHWQQPCLQLLAEHGHHPTQQLRWNWTTGKTPVWRVDFVEEVWNSAD